MTQRTTDLLAAILGISGFSVAILAGLAVGNEPIGVVARALMAMVICSIVGQVLGLMCQRAIDEHVAAFAASHPVPEIEDDTRPRKSTTSQQRVDKK